MPDDQGRPFAEDLAVQFGMTVSDWRARVSRGYAPKVADRVVHNGAVRSVWDPEEIAEYAIARERRNVSRGLRPDGGKWDAVRSEDGALVDRQMDCTQPLPSEIVRADHPHTDPGDGRIECERCGKFVWLVTHSCKRVPVTPAAIERYNAGRPEHERIQRAV